MKDIYRILTPDEYEALRGCIPKTEYRMRVDLLLFTGMRYSEAKSFSGHLAWFDADNRCISLPGASTKTGMNRVVHLTPAFSKSLSMYLKEFKSLDMPDINSMDDQLKRWWLMRPQRMAQPNNWWPTCKTFRKTWESWLLSVRRKDGSPKFSYMDIARSQGHTVAISERHYANLDPRLKSQQDAIRRLTEGWMQ